MNKYKDRAFNMAKEERDRQIQLYGYDLKHDIAFERDSELAQAAIAFLLLGIDSSRQGYGADFHWPWPKEFFKPTPDNRKRELTKAAALVLAELERILALEDGYMPLPQKPRR